jgi:carbonic anhydrase
LTDINKFDSLYSAVLTRDSGVRLFMLLGHDSCAAVNGAISAIHDGAVLPVHIPSLVEAIGPAVGLAEEKSGNLLENAIRENVRMNAATVRASSPILSKLAASDELKVVGGVYNLKTGRIELID